MKKIIFLLFFLFSLSGYCQFPEGFEGSSTNLPTGWTKYQQGAGALKTWGVIQPPASCEGSNMAFIDADINGNNNTSYDYLVTPKITVPANGQLHFLSKQGFEGDQGTNYSISVSTSSDPSIIGAYNAVANFTETDMNTVYNQCQEHVVDLSAYAGQTVYVAFVRVFTQPVTPPGGTPNLGDRWFLDYVNIVSRCFEPSGGVATNIGATTATLDWKDNNNGSNWDIYTVAAGSPAPNANTVPTYSVSAQNKPYSAIDLTPNFAYEFYIRAKCTDINKSAWVGPFAFKTYPLGALCIGPININSLPYQVTDNTGNSLDLYDTAPSCGTVGSGTNYVDGNDVFYSFKATKNGVVSFNMTPSGPNSSIFIYGSCPIQGNCLKGVADATTNVRTISNFPVTAGTTYYVLISSAKVTQTVGYTLVIQEENCIPPSALNATGITTTSASLSWGNPTSATDWEIKVQTIGSGSNAVPTGSGDPVNISTNYPYLASGLIAGTKYQYYVRAKCSDGSFSSWAGPYPFNTQICDSGNTCNYVFKMSDTGGNGWGGNTMQVRQNGIVVTTITLASGAGPVSVSVPLCTNVPFDLYWDSTGTKPNECVVSIINSFGQTLKTKVAGESGPGNIVYSSTAKCDAPLCTIAPNQLNATAIRNFDAMLSWNAPSTAVCDIYVVHCGDPAPSASSIPNYTNVTTNSFYIDQLTADNSYAFYVRLACSPSPSPWSSAFCFTTTPTCPRPTNLSVPPAGITINSAQLYWTKGTPTDTQWEVLLVKAVGPDYGVPATPLVVPNLNTGDIWLHDNTAVNLASPYLITGLEQSTIYYYYVRTVCSGTDKSVWAGPIKFNTTTCNAPDKCNYVFSMTDTGNDGWNGGRMDIRQNGVLITTIGDSIISGGPETVSVPLCSGVPFDVYWTTAGTKPSEIGLQILNSFGDPIYTKLPGDGASNTILFTGTGNCTTPTCIKPSLLKIVSKTSNSAVLRWTPGGSETKWEVYVVSAGGTPPVNGSAINTGKPGYYIADTSTNTTTDASSTPITETFTLPTTPVALNPSTDYDFYVRAICSNSDFSTWTLTNKKTFTTAPANDECIGAINVPVNTGTDCLVKSSGTTKGASGTLPGTGVCVGFADDDIWFSFTATSTAHIIQLNNIVGGTTDLDHILYSGGDCGNLTQLYCSYPNSSLATNLIPGNVYKIRVYTDGNVLNQFASFDVCITTPVPVSNDECTSAINLPVNKDLSCGQTTPGTLTTATASALANPCIGTADDDVWYSFVATSTTHYVNIQNVVGTSLDINHAIYSGTCDGLTLFKCSAAASLTSNSNQFVVGQTYYVRIWSNSSSAQSINFNVCIGTIPPPIITDVTKYTKQQLVQDVLFGTKCANISNVAYSTGTNFGSVNGIGYFEKGDSTFLFQDGVVLTTGNAMSVPGPNNSTLSEGTLAWTGDTQLQDIVKAGTGTAMVSHNASKLEFDFVPFTNKVSFNFMFASEEYGDYQCQFSDAFAFLLTNTKTKETKNLAVIPGTSIPVSVVTIRDAKYHPGSCASQNANYFGTFYGANGVPAISAPINFNGITVPMKAVADSTFVTPGVTYHIKLVIADHDDTSFDSSVFIEGGSFDIGSVNLGADLLMSTDNALCVGQTYTAHSYLSTDVYDISWFKDGVQIAGSTDSDLIVTSKGTYTVKGHFKNSTCDISDSIVVEYYPDAVPGIPSDISKCDDSGQANFDFTANTTAILSPYTGDHTATYFTSLTDAQNNVNAIPNPTSFVNTASSQIIYVRVDNTNTKCSQFVNFTLYVQGLPKFTVDGNMSVCPAESTTVTVVPEPNSFDAQNVTYSWTFNGAPVSNVTTGSLTGIGTAMVGTYTVTVNDHGCVSSKDFEIIANTTPIAVALDSGCTGNLFEIVANPVNGSFDPKTSTYDWTTTDGVFVKADKTNAIMLTKAGSFTVKVTTAEGCSSEESITVNDISCSVPKGISPDGDGKNDNWDLTTLNVKRLEIFNRYGTEVFSKDNYTNQWHGQDKGEADLPDGTYFYVIHNMDNSTSKGWIYVNRKH